MSRFRAARRRNGARSILPLAALVALLLASDAGAKGEAMLAVVGANGRAAYQPAAPLAADLGAVDPRAVPPPGRFLLVFPVDRDGVAIDRGSYYPDSGVVCFVGRGCTGVVERLQRDIPGGSSRGGWLKRFTGGRPTIVTLRSQGRPVALRRLAPIFELALAQGSRAATRPERCVAFVAGWSSRRSRPAAFCLGGGGLWASGRLYRLPARASVAARA